mgnify:CR=1 FL=1
MQLAIYKNGSDTPVAQGDGSATLTGLAPETDVAAGDYQAALFDGTDYGNKVDVPAFKTLPDYAAKGKTAGATDGAAGKPAADTSAQPKAYQDAYTAAYTPAKAAYDAAHPAAPAFDPTGATKPTDANTVADITAWLDAHSIDHTGKTVKADLLALVPTA